MNCKCRIKVCESSVPPAGVDSENPKGGSQRIVAEHNRVLHFFSENLKIQGRRETIVSTLATQNLPLITLVIVSDFSDSLIHQNITHLFV